MIFLLLFFLICGLFLALPLFMRNWTSLVICANALITFLLWQRIDFNKSINKNSGGNGFAQAFASGFLVWGTFLLLAGVMTKGIYIHTKKQIFPVRVCAVGTFSYFVGIVSMIYLNFQK